MEREVFLDTSYAIALAVPADRHHESAVQISEQLERDGTRIVTTRAVLIELGNSLAKQRHREKGVLLLDSIENDPNVRVLPISDLQYLEARTLYRSRIDKEWGLTDCISFVVMQAERLTESLTSDVHFQQAGFRAMLREPAQT